MKQITNFYENKTMFPSDVEVAVMQIGHKCDFLDDCAYLKLAFDYLKKIGKKYNEQLTREDFIEFSQKINTMENKTATVKQQQKKNLFDSLDNMGFKDVGDTNTVIMPMVIMRKHHIDFQLISELEKRLNIKQQPELQQKIEKLKRKEMEKEQKIKQCIIKSHGEKYYKQNRLDIPDIENYCYLRTLVLYYYNTIDIDIDKTTNNAELTLLSYFNFMYPNGNLQDDLEGSKTFAQIKDILDYMDNQQKSNLLATLNMDEKTFEENVEKEKRMNQLVENDGVGLLDNEESQ